MGCWGMGLTQSDAFCEVYERFMERYNNGDAVAVIVSDILSEYHKEFSDEDCVLHDVYFALAKAEWMCCAQSDAVKNKVKHIIETDSNLAFYRESGATEADLRTRRKNLEKFWQSLQTPRLKPRQRRIDPLDRIKELPPVQAGECYAYKHENGYRILVILDRFQEAHLQEQVCCCVFKDTFASLQVNIMEEKIAYIANYIGIEFLGKSSLRKLSAIDIPPSCRTLISPRYITWYGKKKDFHKENVSSLNVSLSGLLPQNSSAPV